MSKSLSRQEIEKAKFTFSIYDFEGNERIDATQLGNALRAMGLFPTLRRISHLGGTRTRNEKLLSVEEFLAIYQDAKQDKEEGTVEDFVECLSSHDKDKSGKLSVTTLSHLLQGYGEEKLDRDETEQVIEECGQPYEDEVDYKDFIKNIMKGPDIRIPPALLIQQARAAQSAGGGDASLELEDLEETTGNGEPGSTNDIKTKEKECSKPDKIAPTNNPIDDSEERPKSMASTKRESVKSKAENEGQDSPETEKAEDNKISRRGSAQTASDIRSRRESSPDISFPSTAGKSTSRKRSSIKSVPEKQVTETSDGVNSYASEKSNKKSISGKRDSVKSTKSTEGGSRKEREVSPDDDDDESTCVSEVSAGGKSLTRTRDSQKSATGKHDREASPDESWASEVSAANISKSASARSSLKVKGNEGHDGKISPDISCASDATAEELMKSRSSLKSAGGSSARSSTKSKKSKEEVKAKFQQPLISLKTDGLFGK